MPNIPPQPSPNFKVNRRRENILLTLQPSHPGQFLRSTHFRGRYPSNSVQKISIELKKAVKINQSLGIKAASEFRVASRFSRQGFLVFWEKAEL